MTYITVNQDGQRYNTDGTSFFKSGDCTEYGIMRQSSMDLVGLLLEALGMGISERDDLLDRLELQFEEKHFELEHGDWDDQGSEYEEQRENGVA